MKGFCQSAFWFVVILGFFFMAVPAHPQQLPIVNHDGVDMYSPDKPFEHITIESCDGPGCGGGAAPVTSVNGQTGVAVVGTVRTVNGQTGPDVSVTPENIQAVRLPTDIVASLADYIFGSGTISGSTVADQSGHGHDATLGSGGEAPAVLANGIAIDGAQNVHLPTALNGMKSWVYAVYINPLPHPFVPDYVISATTLQSSDMGGFAGYNILLFGGTGGLLSWDSFSPAYYDGGARTSCAVPLSGFHILAGTFSTTNDTLFIDGQECTEHFRPHNSYGEQSSGSLYIGANSAISGKGLGATIFRARYYSEELTPSQFALVTGVIRSSIFERGIPTDPVPNPQSAPQLHGIGDSITQGFGADYSWLAALSLVNQPAYVITNWGTYNGRLQGMAGSEPNRVAPQCTTSAGPAVAVIFAGSNDFLDNPTAPPVATYMATEISILKRAGCRVYVGTMLDRYETGAAAFKDAYNLLLRSHAKAYGADGLIDFAANTNLGADGVHANATWFSDGVHPTNAGQTALGVVASNSLNYYFGYKPSNPRVVTANTYTLASGDGAVEAAPTGNAAYTMPDCTGPSGEPYVIANTQSAHTLTITGGASQPINGLTSAITIPSNSTVTLRDTPNPPDVSGCHWTM